MRSRTPIAPVTGLALAAVALAAALASCGDDRATTGDTLVVFAAASLTDAFRELEAAFEADHPGVDVQLNLAASSTLREQILAGAPADVFAPASEPIMDEVVAEGLIDGPPTVFASTELRIAVPVDNPGSVTGIDDLGDPELLVGLCAPGVPCGDLAREALAAAGVEPSLDTEEPDVRALLTKIESGDLDAGIVYASDLATTDRAVGIDLPSTVDVVARYPIAVAAGGANPAGAADFVSLVRSPRGQAILADDGFGGG